MKIITNIEVQGQMIMKQKKLTKYHSYIPFGFKQSFLSFHQIGMQMPTVQTKSIQQLELKGK